MIDDRRDAHDEFLLRQFEALRAEILGIKHRVIRLQTVGITGIPIIIGAAQKYEVTALFVAAPLIILAFVFMLVFEQNSLMRAGEYIKLHIEPVLCKNGAIGWENWLQAKGKRRLAERFFAWSAHLVFAVYLLIAGALAYPATTGKLHPALETLLIAVYGAGAVVAFVVVVWNFRIGHGPPVQNE